MNTNFGKLTDDNIEYAPNAVKIGNILYSNPSKDQYLEAGYKAIVDDRPDEKDGYDIVFKEYAQDNAQIYRRYEYREKTSEQASFQVSKLYLRVALTRLGIWDKFENWLRSFDVDLGSGVVINCFDAYSEALVLDTGNEFFSAYIQKAKSELADFISSDDIDKLLAECKAK